MSNMDPFDEFEFKPLTEGLGFHKKTVTLKEGLKNSGVLEEALQGIPNSLPKSLREDTSTSQASKKHTFEDVLSALEKTPLKRTPASELNITEPLPREKKKAIEAEIEIEMPTGPVQSPFPPAEAFKAPPLRKVGTELPDFLEKPATTGTRRGAADSPPLRRLLPESVSFASAGLDAIIILALALIFLIALVAVTKVDLNGVLANLNKDTMTKLSLMALGLAVMQMYVITSRRQN